MRVNWQVRHELSKRKYSSNLTITTITREYITKIAHPFEAVHQIFCADYLDCAIIHFVRVRVTEQADALTYAVGTRPIIIVFCHQVSSQNLLTRQQLEF